MRCNNCSAPLPEGTKICNACGAALTPESKKLTGAELRKATQKELMFIRERVYGISYEVGRLYKCRLGLLILYLIGIAMDIYYYAVAEPHWERSDIYEYHKWYLVLMIVYSIATIIIHISMLVVLNDLKDYLPRFQIAFTAILLSMSLFLACIVIENVLIYMILAILRLLATLCYQYNLYGSMADISRKLFGKLVGQWIDAGELSEEWERLRRFYVIAFVFQMVITLISSMITMEEGSVPLGGAAFFLGWLETLVMLVVYIVEVKLFKKTWNAMERLEYRKVNRE